MIATRTIRVVGYYETEADKLLYTGVSMNEESSEYKTVIEQLENTVFYVVGELSDVYEEPEPTSFNRGAQRCKY